MPRALAILIAAVALALAPDARAATSDAGVELGADESLLFQVVACGTPAQPVALPATITPALLDGHCRRLRSLLASWRKRWVKKAVPFLAAIVPSNLPTEIVYPFGGGDLFTALATFPNASVITTLSLEAAGDPSRLATASAEEITHALDTFRDDVRRLSFATHSKTTNLRGLRAEVLPEQLAFALMALAAFELEPAGLRYFDVQSDGSLRYLTRDESLARKSERFAHVELTFRERGGGVTRIYRHLQANLGDKALTADPSVLVHLKTKGQVAAMTKAASYLLWSPAFSLIRDYLLTHADWMISDSTGVPPRFAQAAGFEQETWGRFTGAFLKVNRSHDEEFVRLWESRPERPLPFGFGYPDKDDNNHLLVTRRRSTTP